jgi:hypothetical protein
MGFKANSLKLLLCLMLLFAGLALPEKSQAQAPPADAWREAPPTSTGIEVGKQIPAFSIPDQFGKQRDFKSIVGPNGAMIVFQRSVDW